MDQRVFGPYYNTPPEQQDQPTATQARFNQPLQATDEAERPATRTSLRQRLLAGRRRKTRTTRP